MDCEEESEVLITTSTYHHHNSADSGVSTEYRTLRDCYPELVDHVKLQLTTTSSALFSKSYVPNNIHEYSTSDGVSDEKKAKKLLDPVLAKVKLNPDTYHGFVDILGREGPWADDIIKHLKDHFHSIKSEMKQTQHKGLVERASDTKRVLVTVDNREDSKERLYITENIQTLQNLTEEIRQMFQLDGHCIITLQIWDASFNDFVSIKDMNEIQDCCKINAATRKQAQTPQIQTQVVYCGTNIFLGQSNMPANVNPRRQSNTFPRSQGALGAYIVYNKLWKEREVLKVFFKNPEVIRKWKCRNEPMTTTNILAWAAVWNHPFHSNIIPTLEITENIENSDIRVQFLEESSGCWSMVGTNAVGKDITMVLDLSRHPPNVQRSLVIHEFGHALGLEHEHQRSDFWDIVGKHVDLEKMRKDISVQRAPESDDEQGGVGFEKDWEAKIGGGEEEYTAVKSEYDSKSIMHYCFDVKWLKDGVSTLADIETHPDLSNKEKKYLKAILQRSGIGPLPKEPSKLDIQELVKAYETTGRRQKPPLEMTKSFQNPTSNEHVTLDDAHMEEKDTQEPKIWTGRSVLKVYFINPKKLEEWANGTRIDNIMTWASSWNSPLYDQIPRFEETEDNLTADIRVMFSASSGSWSAVGTDVQKVKKMKPTMMLDLKSYNRYFQRYLVIHQFGHALGLEHEHQRMDFWDGIRKHIDTEKMGNDKTTGNYSSVSSKAFKRDWLELGVKAHRESVIPYDPQSIMHWWFAVEWLKDLKYHKLENIKSDSSLTDDEKRFLEAIHARNRKYVLAPSKSDFEYLGEVYSRLGDHEEKATEFESSKVEELLKQVDVNKIKGIWLSTTDVSDSDQAQETWKKIARFTAETNLDLYREIVEKCRL